MDKFAFSCPTPQHRTALLDAQLQHLMSIGQKISMLCADDKAAKKWRSYFKEHNYENFEIIQPPKSAWPTVSIDEGAGRQLVEKEFVFGERDKRNPKHRAFTMSEQQFLAESQCEPLDIQPDVEPEVTLRDILKKKQDKGWGYE